MSLTFHLSWFDRCNVIGCRAPIMSLVITQFSLCSCYFVSLKYSYHISLICFLPLWLAWSVFTPIKTSNQNYILFWWNNSHCHFTWKLNREELCLILWSRVHFEKAVVTQLVKKSLTCHFMWVSVTTTCCFMELCVEETRRAAVNILN